MKLFFSLTILLTALIFSSFAETAILTFKTMCYKEQSSCMDYRNFFDLRDSYDIGAHTSNCKRATADSGPKKIDCPVGQWGFVPYVHSHKNHSKRVNPVRSFCSAGWGQSHRYSDFLNTIVTANGQSYFKSSVRELSPEEKKKYRNTECEGKSLILEAAVYL